MHANACAQTVLPERASVENGERRQDRTRTIFIGVAFQLIRGGVTKGTPKVRICRTRTIYPAVYAKVTPISNLAVIPWAGLALCREKLGQSYSRVSIFASSGGSIFRVFPEAKTP